MTDDRTIDRDALVEVLEGHPIDLAVLFGSVVDGQTHPNSDVDLGALSDLEPRIGLAAVEEGVVLVGDPDRFDDHRDRFEAAIEDRPPASERFDAVIERVDEALQG